jgi:hypothetical protein
MAQQARKQTPAPQERSYLAMLALEQGIAPVTDFEALLGDFWPEDEAVEDFEKTLRQWRLEGEEGE